MSCSRHCAIFKAVDGRWFLELGNQEHAERDNSTTYGPFADEGAVDAELERHSNPGGMSVDDSGTAPVPARSGDGGPVQPPFASRMRVSPGAAFRRRWA